MISREPSLVSAAQASVVGVLRGDSVSLTPLGSAVDDSVFRIASLTKPVTACAVVSACRTAGVSLDTPVVDLLPFPRQSWRADRAITVAQLLSQTSGLLGAVTSGEVAALPDHDAILEAARLVVRAGSSAPPGRVWRYDNGNYFVAGAVAAALHGSSFEDVVDELVLRPWGMLDTSFEAPQRLVPGREQGTQQPALPYPVGRRPSGGLCSTAGDLVRFLRGLQSDPDLLATVRLRRTVPSSRTPYGLGWAIGPSGQLYANGRLPGYRTAMLLVPDHDLGAVVLSADSTALPAAADVLSDVQRPVTGDDLAALINAFAA